MKIPDTFLSARHPLGEVLDYIDNVNPNLYTPLVIDLTSALTMAEFQVPGDTLTVEYLDGTAAIVFNNAEKSPVSLNLNRRFITPFRRFFVTATAQPGKTLRVVVGRDAAFESYPLAATKIVGSAGVDVEPASMATMPDIYNVTLTLANTQYSQALPAGTKKFIVKTRDGTAFRLAFVTGKVAAPVEPYLSVPLNGSYAEDNVYLSAATIYAACADAAKTLEIVCWS